jgi:glucose/arabinose dehydrogenase
VLLALVVVVSMVTVSSGAVAQDDTVRIGLELVTDGLVDPVSVRAPDDGTDRLFVAEKYGNVRIIEDGVLLEKPFIDLRHDTAWKNAEQGLYDIAFHPDFENNGLVYVSHTHSYLNGALVVWEYPVSPDDPNIADAKARRPVIAIQRRAGFHNGGTIEFGPDGYLYIGVGEGLPYGDPFTPNMKLSQSLESLDGKLLRIDVDVPRAPTGDAQASYLVPANPFGGPVSQEFAYRSDMDAMRGNTFASIWAMGLRNPWKFAFDPVTGDLFIPDVGERSTEEINHQPATSTGGENYGWSDMEGTTCAIDDCSSYTPPVYAYDHTDSRCAVIGIGVYRAAEIEGLDGGFLFADYCSGEIAALVAQGGQWARLDLGALQNVAEERFVAGGGSDVEGNVYVASCTCDGWRRSVHIDDDSRKTGAIWKVTSADGQTQATPPAATPIAENRPHTRVRRSRHLAAGPTGGPGSYPHGGLS